MEALLSPVALIVFHAAVVAAIGGRVVMAKPAPSIALSWLLLVAIVPGIGLVCYLLFGERRIGGHRRARHQALQPVIEDFQVELRRLPAADVAWEGLSDAAAMMHRLGQSLGALPTLTGNALELMPGAEAVLRAIITDIDQAQRTLHLQFYIWHPGGLADEAAAAVERAAGRGVKCRVLVDALGSSKWLRGPWPARLRKAGAEVAAALPAGLLRVLLRRSDLRNHRKIVVVDGETAYTGSMNMVDPRHFKKGAGVGQWVDAMVRVRGPVVAGLLAVSLNDWFMETDASVEQLRASSGLRAVPPAGGAAVQVLPTGPARGGDGCLQMLLAMLFAAHQRVVITTPYFVPDEALLRAIRGASARGVEVRLIVPAKVDSLLVRYASRSYYDDLLSAGVRIHFYTGGLLHTKSVVVDGRLAMFGTHNIDLRSLWLNFEVSLFVYDEGFGKLLAALHEDYLRQCEQLDPAAWRSRPWSRRLRDNLLRLFSPLL